MSLLPDFVSRFVGLAKPTPVAVRAPAASRTAASTGFAPSTMDSRASAPRSVLRRDLLRMALRDLQQRSGIPAAWLSLDVVPAARAEGGEALLVRLVLKQWQPRVLEHAPALERLFIQRVTVHDPMASQWLLGLSWRLELPESFDPAPLPPAQSWQPALAQAVQASPARAAATPVRAAAAMETAPVISGPTVIRKPRNDARQELERLMAAGDRFADSDHSFAPTQPGGFYDDSTTGALNSR
jgi:hypothetical protein